MPGTTLLETMGQKPKKKRLHPLQCTHSRPPNKTPQVIPPESPRGSGATPAGALADKMKLPPLATQKTPRRFYPNCPGARGLHPQVRSRRPAVKTKIPQMILPESPRGSGAPVGFINLGSLMDRLPNKGSTQQTTLRETRNSWAGP